MSRTKHITRIGNLEQVHETMMEGRCDTVVLGVIMEHCICETLLLIGGNSSKENITNATLFLKSWNYKQTKQHKVNVRKFNICMCK